MKLLNETLLAKNVKETVTKERYLEVVASFKKYGKKPNAHEAGSCFEMYVLYALVRGKSPQSTTHNTKSDTYEKAVFTVLKYLNGKANRNKWCDEGRKSIMLDKAFGLTEDEAMNLYFSVVKSKEIIAY
ncbi:hypothetical protein LMH73_012405 [Vibrio splendidus]|nr:hypothetical protein [Vibrio splendidus]MCC4880704.1 hypothetical protein [Vibrio splendidus]